MTDRPILFNDAMVRAILNGTKTQTRRIVKPPFAADAVPVEMPATDPVGGWVVPGHSGVWWCEAAANADDVRRCPYGKPGDRLWVRETWARDDEDGCLMYRADIGSDVNADAWQQGRREGVQRYRWRPSIHMARWASRITLEVTGVRVERLQQISEADAIAEGVTPNWAPGCSGRLMEAVGGFSFRPAASAYAALWESINGPGSWDANPWVWVVQFAVKAGNA